MVNNKKALKQFNISPPTQKCSTIAKPYSPPRIKESLPEYQVYSAECCPLDTKEIMTFNSSYFLSGNLRSKSQRYWRKTRPCRQKNYSWSAVQI